MLAFSLRPVFRKVFILCAIQGFTIEETAALLRISPAAAALRLARARREIDVRLGLTDNDAGCLRLQPQSDLQSGPPEVSSFPFNFRYPK